MFIQANTIDDLLRESFDEVLRAGQKCKGSKGEYIELLGVSLELTNPRSRLSRTEIKGHIFSCLGELFWYLSGSDDGDAISYYISGYKEFVEADNTVGGAYGPRLFGVKKGGHQFANLIKLVASKPSTRQAVIQIFDEVDLEEPRKKEIPCTLTFQFLLRDDELHMIVNMRSNDAYVGLPHDLFCFTMLQELFAVAISAELGRPICLGSYKHFASSFHIYEKNLPNVQDFLDEGYTSTRSVMSEMPSNSYSILSDLVELEKNIRLGNTDNLRETANKPCNLGPDRDFLLPA